MMMMNRGGGASLTSIKHHYRIAPFSLSFQYLERGEELDKWKQLMARWLSNKKDYLARIAQKNSPGFCDVTVIFSSLEKNGGTRKSALTAIISSAIND